MRYVNRLDEPRQVLRILEGDNDNGETGEARMRSFISQHHICLTQVVCYFQRILGKVNDTIVSCIDLRQSKSKLGHHEFRHLLKCMTYDDMAFSLLSNLDQASIKTGDAQAI